MRLRIFLIAAAIVGAFVFLTNRQISPIRTLLPDPGPAWSGPVIAAGLSSDETNNIAI
jgi:hypothetical protein